MTYQEIENRLKDNPNGYGKIIADIDLIKTSFYEQALTGECLSKAERLMGFSEPLLVTEGTLITSNGELKVGG